MIISDFKCNLARFIRVNKTNVEENKLQTNSVHFFWHCCSEISEIHLECLFSFFIK